MPGTAVTKKGLGAPGTARGAQGRGGGFLEETRWAARRSVRGGARAAVRARPCGRVRARPLRAMRGPFHNALRKAVPGTPD